MTTNKNVNENLFIASKFLTSVMINNRQYPLEKIDIKRRWSESKASEGILDTLPFTGEHVANGNAELCSSQ
jgi:hypothetical protein